MTELTAALIADISLPQTLQLSPDGRYVAYTLRPLSKKEEHATSAIWLAPTNASHPARQFTRGDVADSNPQWSPDGSQIAFLSDRAKRGTSQLYLIPTDGGEAQPLTPTTNKKAVSTFAWSPAGGHIAFTSADEPTEEDERREKERDDAQVYGERRPYARLRLASLASREVATLVSGNRHIQELAWHPHSAELAYVVWPSPELNSISLENVVERIPLAGGEPQAVCRFPGNISSLTWSSDGQTILFIASASAKSQSSMVVYAVPAQGGEPRRIASGETNCAEDLCQLQQDEQVMLSILQGLETHFCKLDPGTGAVRTLFPTAPQDRAGDYGDWHVRTIESGKTMFAVARSSATQLREVWAGLIEGAAGEPALHQLSSHQEQFAGLAFGPQEPFFWTASDGLKLDGILVRPPHISDNRPLPTVVLVHGGPYWRWSQALTLNWGNWSQWLALAGYAVLMPNPRGGSGHGEEFAAAARGDVGGADYGDVMSAVDAAIERGIADPERLGIGGWSQGGFMTAWAVTQTARFKAAIMGAGVSDWGMMAMSSDLPEFESELGGSVPWDGLALHQHMKLSPITFAHQVKTPVLILHGEKDERVPISQAIGYHRALRDCRVPTELVIYPREPHGISERAHQIDLLQRVRTWYDRWLRS